MSKKIIKDSIIKLNETFTNSTGKNVPRSKATWLTRVFTVKNKVVKTVNIAIKDLPYYVDIGDYDSGGKTVEELKSYIHQCRNQIHDDVGMNRHPLLHVMIKNLIEKYKSTRQQLLDAQDALPITTDVDRDNAVDPMDDADPVGPEDDLAALAEERIDAALADMDTQAEFDENNMLVGDAAKDAV